VEFDFKISLRGFPMNRIAEKVDNSNGAAHNL
jgi:hypothetical protein